MDKKVSIIVPIYNAEKYLDRCINSIINQTYDNIEIILINDGSKDDSLNIIKQYKMRDKRIKVYNQKNSGTAITRNNGIEYALGKYIMFVDDDDYIDNDYVETFVKAISEKDYDYVVGGFKYVIGEDIQYKKYKDCLWSYFIFITPWSRIFNKEFLVKNNIHFLPIKMGEDIHFSIQAYHIAII